MAAVFDFHGNSARLVLTMIAFNLLRAAGTIASRFHARATTGIIRAQLISVAARIIKSARRIRLRLPTTWSGRRPGTGCSPPPSPHPTPPNPSTADPPERHHWGRAGQIGSSITARHRVQLNARPTSLTRIAIGASGLRRVVGIRNLPFGQSVADVGGRVGQPELAIVRVQPML